MNLRRLLTNTLLVATLLIGGGNFAWAVEVPTPVYFNDFSSNTGLTIVGSGEYITDSDARFGRIYHNDPNLSKAVRTNYLQLPSDVLSHSTTSKEMTIGVWVNKKNAETYSYYPLFAAYTQAPRTDNLSDYNVTTNENGMPMFVCQSRGLLQYNNEFEGGSGSWCNFENAQNDNGANTESNSWLDDGKWHYYAVTLTETKAVVYVDGTIVNSWTLDNSTAGQKLTPLLTNTTLTYVTLGGNQAWGWNDADPAFGFDDFSVYDKALTKEQIDQIVYDKLNNEPIATSVTVTSDVAASTTEKQYVKYEFNAWTNAHEYCGGGTGGTYGGTSGQTDAKGWATHTANRQIRVTLNHPLEAGDVITVNAACSYGGTDNRCPVGIATYAQNDIKGKKYLTLRFPTVGYTSNTNYDLSYTITANDSLCGKSELYIGGHNGTGGTVYFYFKSVKVTSDDASDAYAPQTLSNRKTWTFEGLTTESRTAGAMMNEYLFIGADETHAVGVVEDSRTIGGTAYTKALDFATSNNNNNLTNGVSTTISGCIMIKVPAGYGKVTVVGRNVGSNTTFFYNIGQTSRTNIGNYNSNSTDTKTFIYNVSESKPIIIYQGKSYDTSEIYIYSVTWEPLTVEATIGNTGWTTFANSYPLDLSKMEASTGEVKAYYASSVGSSSVTMTTTEAAIQAGEGIMLKGTPTATITIPVAASGEAISGNKLVGVTTNTTITKETENYANFFVLSNNNGTAEFQNLKNWLESKKSGSDTEYNTVTINAGKAYLDATGATGARLSIAFDDETTGVQELKNSKIDGLQTGDCYNLRGQRVSQPTKGLYIVNGKKVIMK